MTDEEPAVDLSITIGGAGRKGDPLRLANPIIAAAGTLGTGGELLREIDLGALGALVTPAITRRARRRLTIPPCETPAGLFLAGPYPSLSLAAVLRRSELWEEWPVPMIANVPADDADECIEIAMALADHAGIAAIELSLVSLAEWLDGDGSVQEFQRLCRQLSDAWPRPLIVKLPYGLTSTLALIAAAVDSGADAISLGGGFPASVVDRRGAPDRVRLVAGRVTGPATHPPALHVVAAVCAETRVPVIASGGVTSATEALDFLQAGARAVQVGSASLRDPSASVRVARDMERLVRSADLVNVRKARARFQGEAPPL